jgi:hypothetical protein
MSAIYDYDAFLSHSSKDKSVVLEIADLLEGDGLRVWLYETETQPGELWRRKLEEAVVRSRALLLFMSPNAVESQWVEVESDMALSRDPNNSHGRLIPVLLEDCEVSPMLKRLQFVDWRKKSPEEYQRLLGACRRAGQAKGSEANREAEAKSPNQPFDIPPDEGFQRQRISEGPTSLALIEADFHSLPLDVSSAWGLDRGSFTGLLAGRRDDGVYQALLRTEAALWRCLRESAAQPALPIRWWLRIRTGLSPAPETQEQVWDGVVEQSSNRLSYLRKGKLDKNMLLGFFCELESLDAEVLPSILSWCESLFRLFPSHSSSVVFDVSDPDPSAVTAAGYRLRRYFTQRSTRVDALFLFPRGMAEPPPVSVRPLPPHLSSLIPGFGTRIDLQRAAGATEEVLEAHQLIESLDASTGRTLGAYREILEWTRQNMPALFLPLLRAGACSSCAQGRRESLVFAIKADRWLDVWLAAADLGQPQVLIELATPADPESGVVVDHLALALMRRLDREGGPESLEALLAALSPRLSRELLLVDRLRKREIEVDNFLSTSGPRVHRLALRAGLSPWPSRKLLETVDLDRVDFWRLLTAMAIDGARIGDLLSLPHPACRAVFGLCTAREWAVIESDATLARLVLEARRGRTLDFN